MPIVRGPRPDRDFTVIRNSVINDGRLSLEARFILIYLLSKPETWSVNAQDLINQSKASARPSGKTSIYASLKELADLGYLHRRRLAAGGMQYTVYEIPRDEGKADADAENSPQTLASHPLAANQEVGTEPLPEKRQVEASHPLPEKPLLEKPLLGNQTLVKTEVVVRKEKAEKPDSLRVMEKRSRGKKLPLQAFIAGCREAGEKVIPDADPVFAYADTIGLPYDMVSLCWKVFREKHVNDDSKRYVDWRAHFRNAVRGAWYGLWRIDAGSNEYKLTTAGEQARRIYERTAA
ncbi:hypothetical protein AWB71_00927 [Caballeronia peredens]|nr:hypothetical protein AWB71_00927 [Caballeronia peredens]